MALSRQELLTLARHGAIARLRELEVEIGMIRRAFPGLGGAPRRGPGRLASSAEGAIPAKRRRRRRRMSAEARKRISEMMKKRWAERRKAKK